MEMHKICPSCGAQLSYAEEIQTNCSYCGEPLLMNIPDDAICAEFKRRGLEAQSEMDREDAMGDAMRRSLVYHGEATICIREDGHDGPCNGFPRPQCCRPHGPAFTAQPANPEYAVIRQQAARECAEIVRKFMISDHYPIGMNEARDAILRKFGIDEK